MSISIDTPSFKHKRAPLTNLKLKKLHIQAVKYNIEFSAQNI